jgi:hypothetical protein
MDFNSVLICSCHYRLTTILHRTHDSNSHSQLTCSCHILTDKVKVKVILWPTVRRPVYFRVKHPSGSQDQIFITVRQLQVCWCGIPFLTRGQVCCLQLLLVLASAVIINSKSHGFHDHILPSVSRLPQPGGPGPHIYITRNKVAVILPGTGFPFCCLLRLAGLWWRCLNPPPPGGGGGVLTDEVF